MEWGEYPKSSKILVSTNGDVVSYKRGYKRELSKSINNNGYYQVGVGHANPVCVHRMVAETFIFNPDPMNKTDVNHKDGNKLNNSVDNLEWVSKSENSKHAYAIGLQVNPHRKKIRILETGEIFDSYTDCAARIGGSTGHICQCLSGERHTHKGYHFEAIDEYEGGSKM